MKSILAAFKTLKNVMGGEVVTEISTLANLGFTTMSLFLKKNKSGEHYVVLAELSRGNRQYASFTSSEFEQFSDAVNSIQSALRQHSERSAT
jgi:hypothetical protein